MSGIQRHVRTTTDRLLQNPNAFSTHILLGNVPRTAIPADIKRLCFKHKVDSVSHIALDYYRFTPTGRAWLTLNSSTHMRYTLKSLKGSVISGKLLDADAAHDPKNPVNRTRGVKGRLEAAERGLVTGSGPDGASTSHGRGVVIQGLPGKLTPEGLRSYLKDFKLAATEGGRKEIVKLDTPNLRLTIKSRFFVRLASVAEAHRLVRELHMTYFESKFYDNKYSLRAAVVY
ncbi:hypothetical protein DAEQUDRAFT_812632 [Daedalea quercina L-15889]|uniref:RRM domain-containing protein n=1 Tax=Daedalea quercina L-15889 TaxID=1314783 RepID=A0A165P4X3_9APHY|nr:hypothetical protein DAEQUDRAFT_812632 [Daedalea quercina L-15889]